MLQANEIVVASRLHVCSLQALAAKHERQRTLLARLQERRDRLEADKARLARSLEEAAKVAENEAKNLPSDEWHQGFRSGCRGAASSIRALKEPT